jgi:hypothetical protein
VPPFGSVVASLLLLSTAAALEKPALGAQLDKLGCIDASDQGQRLQSSGKLLAARERFVACSSLACPGPVRQACAGWLNDVERAIPSLVLAAKETVRTCDGTPAAARDLADVDVSLDDRPFAHGLSGLAVDVDPGRHVLRFQAPGRPPHDEPLLVHEGEKSRAVVVTLEGQAPACSRDLSSLREADTRSAAASFPSAGPPVAAIAATATSAAAFGIMTYFGVRANSYYHDHQGCAPHCGSDAKSTLEVLEDVTDVSLGVGVAAAALAAWLWLAPRGAPPVVPTSRGPLLSISF